MPNLGGSILFLEDDLESKAQNFDRDLQSLLHQPDFHEVKGLVIGRFQKASKVSKEHLIRIIKTKEELKNIPVITDVNFGHTSPIFTFPIGGQAILSAKDGVSKLVITNH